MEMNTVTVYDIQNKFIAYSCVYRPGQTMEMNTVTVYDIQNKFIAYSAPFPAVIGVFCEWGSLYVLAGDRKVGDCTLTLLNTFLELSFIVLICAHMHTTMFPPHPLN